MPLSPTDTVTSRDAAIAVSTLAVTVTEVPDAPSPTLDGVTVSVTGGRSDASWIDSEVSVTGMSSEGVLVARASLDSALWRRDSKIRDSDTGVCSAAVPLIVTSSRPSYAVSVSGSKSNVPVPLVALAAIVIVKSDTAL